MVFCWLITEFSEVSLIYLETLPFGSATLLWKSVWVCWSNTLFWLRIYGNQSASGLSKYSRCQIFCSRLISQLLKISPLLSSSLSRLLSKLQNLIIYNFNFSRRILIFNQFAVFLSSVQSSVCSGWFVSEGCCDYETESLFVYFDAAAWLLSVPWLYFMQRLPFNVLWMCSLICLVGFLSFSRLNSGFYSTVRVSGPNVTAASLSTTIKFLNQPLLYQRFTSSRVIMLCNLFFLLYIRFTVNHRCIKHCSFFWNN